MSKLFNLEKTRHERELQKVAKEAHEIADIMFVEMGRRAWTVKQANIFANSILPVIVKEMVGGDVEKAIEKNDKRHITELVNLRNVEDNK